MLEPWGDWNTPLACFYVFEQRVDVTAIGASFSRTRVLLFAKPMRWSKRAIVETILRFLLSEGIFFHGFWTTTGDLSSHGPVIPEKKYQLRTYFEVYRNTFSAVWISFFADSPARFFHNESHPTLNAREWCIPKSWGTVTTYLHLSARQVAVMRPRFASTVLPLLCNVISSRDVRLARTCTAKKNPPQVFFQAVCPQNVKYSSFN